MPNSSPHHWIQRLVASRAVRSGYASAIAHVVVLIVLALMFLESRNQSRPRPIRIAFAAAQTDAGAADDAGAVDMPAAVDAPEPEPPLVPLPATDVAADDPILPAPPEPEPAPAPVAAQPVSVSPADLAADLRTAPVVAGTATAAGADAFAVRGAVGRAEAVRARGGSAASEEAVERGLAWLALHQGADGSWRFDLSNCRCAGACRNPGTVPSTTAATGLALLPFLGAGHTHRTGAHAETVTKGLYYLLGRMQATPRGGDLAEGTMYGHGVATLALAEALGMTRDEMLVRPVGDAVRFIVTAQDSYGGGWRYLPGQSGDTTVTAWQLAALKAAFLAGVAVPTPTIDGVSRFLDRVQSRNGEAYGYLGPQPQPCTSAIGLFCRLHTGWKERDRLARGLAALARSGPDANAVYLNFYLAQALLQADHAAWPSWNRRNRDQLVARQTSRGHEAGSWSFTDPETAPGGRLGHTALALLTLEVYYRLLPIYRPEAVEREW